MGRRVLIVDDSNTNNFLLQSILEMEGIQSHVAMNGKEAFKYLEIEKPSLILLDIMMPNLDGFSVLEKIKQNSETSEVPIVFVTAKNDENLKKKAIEAGAKDLIQKPIDVHQVIDIVKQLITN